MSLTFLHLSNLMDNKNRYGTKQRGLLGTKVRLILLVAMMLMLVNNCIVPSIAAESPSHPQQQLKCTTSAHPPSS